MKVVTEADDEFLLINENVWDGERFPSGSMGQYIIDLMKR